MFLQVELYKWEYLTLKAKIDDSTQIWASIEHNFN